MFPGNDLDAPASPDGLNYCLTSAGDNPQTGNAPVTGHNGPLIKNGVVITLPTVQAGFDLHSISNVGFQYGTSQHDPFLIGVPEPSSLLLLVAGALLCTTRAGRRQARRR